ncbi:hypothetical protein [uncultured Nostoc sp.]|uniref:hypothetical protein n=1 Tax=uncultured Nostoc sp. TaxID=340711 RepID=UPI0035CB3BDA
MNALRNGLFEGSVVLVIDGKGSSTARRKSKVKSQKSKVLWNGFFRDFKWLLYLRRGLLVEKSAAASREKIFFFAST